MASRYRVLGRPIIAQVEKVVVITKAVVWLHNFLMSLSENSNNNYNYCPDNYVDEETAEGIIPGEWRKDSENATGIHDPTHAGSNNYSKHSAMIRDEFKEYFNSEGAVEWQWDIVSSTGSK